MKKIIITTILTVMLAGLLGCSKKQPSVVKTYEATYIGQRNEKEGQDLLTLVEYYEMSDGTWRTDDAAYQYRLEITGRMNHAAKDSTFVYLSNIEDITFEQAWKASGLSSDMRDYFKTEEAVLVAVK